MGKVPGNVQRAIEKSKVTHSFSNDYAKIFPSQPSGPALDDKEKNKIRTQTENAIAELTPLLAEVGREIADKLVAAKDGNFSELMKNYEAKAQEIQTRISELRTRFDKIKTKNFKRRKRIEKFPSFISFTSIRLRLFLHWKNEALQERGIFRRSQFMHNRRKEKFKNNCFNAWRRLTAGAASGRRRQQGEELGQQKAEAQYAKRIEQLQTSIVNFEREIERIDVLHSELSYNLSQQLLQAMSSLSVEVMELRQIEIERSNPLTPNQLNDLREKVHQRIMTKSNQNA